MQQDQGITFYSVLVYNVLKKSCECYSVIMTHFSNYLSNSLLCKGQSKHNWKHCLYIWALITIHRNITPTKPYIEEMKSLKNINFGLLINGFMVIILTIVFSWWASQAIGKYLSEPLSTNSRSKYLPTLYQVFYFLKNSIYFTGKTK